MLRLKSEHESWDLLKVWFGGNLRRVNENDNAVFNLKDIKQTSVLQRLVFLHKANDLNLSIMFN